MPLPLFLDLCQIFDPRFYPELKITSQYIRVSGEVELIQDVAGWVVQSTL
jgi:hypothetical protein